MGNIVSKWVATRAWEKRAVMISKKHLHLSMEMLRWIIGVSSMGRQPEEAYQICL